METFWILGALSVIVTAISFRWQNAALSLTATLLWFALWLYNLTNPLTGIAIGSLIHDVLTYAFLMMTGGVMVAYLVNKRKGYTGYPMTAQEQAEYNRKIKEEPEEKGIMAMSPTEYKSFINRRRTRR